MRLTRKQFRVLLDLFMVSDPWPLERAKHDTMDEMLDSMAKGFGYEDWIIAWHFMEDEE